MMKIGNSDINALYLGEQEVLKVYKGENLVWQNVEPEPEPEEILVSWSGTGNVSAFTETGTVVITKTNATNKDISYSTPIQFPEGSTITGVYVQSQKYHPTTLDKMFYKSSGITFVAGSEILCTSACTSLENMASRCNKLKVFNTRGWDTSNVTSMANVFYNCTALTSVPGIEEWDPGKVGDMQGMFYLCNKVNNLDLSGWDTSNATSLYQTFYQTTGLTNLNVAGWDTSKVTNMTRTFYRCAATTLDLSTWSTAKVTVMTDMFSGCTKTQKLILGPNFYFKGGCPFSGSTRCVPSGASTNFQSVKSILSAALRSRTFTSTYRKLWFYSGSTIYDDSENTLTSIYNELTTTWAWGVYNLTIIPTSTPSGTEVEVPGGGSGGGDESPEID